MQALAPEARDLLGERRQRPLRATVAGEIGPGEHELLERRPLCLVQHRPAAALGPVMELGQSFRIVSRTTASCSACRSMPESRAASARLLPSSAWAIAYIREAARGSFSRRAKARRSPALKSVRISNATTIGFPLLIRQGNHQASQAGRAKRVSSGVGRYYPGVRWGVGRRNTPGLCG
jgi:hypothetical protein